MAKKNECWGCSRHAAPPKNPYKTKPVKILCNGGPLNGIEVRVYPPRVGEGPDKEFGFKEVKGKYVLGEYVRKFYKQPKGKPRENFEEITPCYNWEETA